MIHILFAGAAITYTGIKLYQSLREPTSSLSAVKGKDTPDKEGNLPTEDGRYKFDRIMKSNMERDFAISSASFALSAAGTLIYPPLTLISIAGLFYITVPIWQKGYYSLFEKRCLNMAVLDSIALPGIFLTGHYFIAALGYWFYSLSEVILRKTEDRSMQSLVGIFGEQPDSVWLAKNGNEIEVPFDSLQLGDIIVVNAGEAIPVDGVIHQGAASVDQHVLTGESRPSDKGEGEQVFAATILLSGKIYIEVKKAGSDTVAAKIGELLTSTVDFKTSVQSKGQRIADNTVLPTMVAGALAFPVAGMTGTAAVLLSCMGDNVRIISPISVLNFLKIASDQGILVKDGRALEQLPQVDTVVFDKTGTLTEEQPYVGNIYSQQEYQENDVLIYAAAAEYKQKHPVAKAIIQAAHERNLILPEIEEARYETGYGIRVTLSGQTVRVGSIRFMELERIDIPKKLEEIISNSHELGCSIVMVAVDNQVAGAIELHATIRPEAESMVSELRRRNISLYIISGDHEKPTRRVAQQLGIKKYFAETLPEKKAELIQQLIDSGKVVCFIGDGINDSVALKKAHVSISLKGASTIATDTAQIIFMDSTLKHLRQLFTLADELEKNLQAGLVTTIVPGVFVIGGVFLMHLGVIGAIMLFNGGLMAGVVNSMWPLMEHHAREKSKTQ